MTNKKKVNFNKILEFIHKIDASVGSLLFKDSFSAKTRNEKILTFTWPLNAFITAFLIISTLIVTKFKFINVVFCLSIFMIILLTYVSLTKLVLNKNVVRELLTWCEGLYDVDNKYHALVKTVAEAHLLTMESRSLKILKLVRYSVPLDAIVATAGFAVVVLFLPESVYPKYSPPLPYYLPFKHQDTWFAFITTVLVQTLFFYQIASLAVEIFGIFFCLAIHIMGFLDIVKHTIVEKFKQELLTNFMTVDAEEPKPSTSKLQSSVLATINQSVTKTTINKATASSFNLWMPILIEMISDVNNIMTSYVKLYTEFCLFFEIASLGCLFTSGLLFIVLRQQYFLAIGDLLGPILLFIFCFINEKILEKFDDIKEALYDIPWYELTPKERKTLLIAMNCDKIQEGLTAAGVHKMTVERFAIVMRLGYKNLLVLKDIVMK